MFTKTDKVTNFVSIEMENGDVITVELYPSIAPITVENFKNLVSEGFYNGTVFHRVIENFMIQGGGYVPNGDKLAEKDAETIKGEFTANGVKNNLTHVRGVISMARVGGKNDSASSQFFIMHATSPSLNDQYASFGYVLAGMDVVDAIATCDVDNPLSSSPQPLENVVVESITFVQPK